MHVYIYILFNFSSLTLLHYILFIKKYIQIKMKKRTVREKYAQTVCAMRNTELYKNVLKL